MRIAIDLNIPGLANTNGPASCHGMTTVYIPVDDTVKSLLRQGYTIANVRLCDRTATMYPINITNR